MRDAEASGATRSTMPDAHSDIAKQVCGMISVIAISLAVDKLVAFRMERIRVIKLSMIL